MNFHLVTLFPESFDSYISSSIIGRAVVDKKIKVKFYNPRDFIKPTKTQSKNEKPYLRVDDKPFGGGPGMVIQAMPIVKAIEKILKITHPSPLIIWLTPGGKQFDNTFADKVSKKYSDVIIICGRYEGIDERVKKIIKDLILPAPFALKGQPKRKIDFVDLSIGPYVVTGGELPAMIIIDTISRRIPGILGSLDSLEESRVASSEVYTRPEAIDFKGKKYCVPKVLLSGHHKKIEEWRNKKSK